MAIDGPGNFVCASDDVLCSRATWTWNCWVDDIPSTSTGDKHLYYERRDASNYLLIYRLAWNNDVRVMYNLGGSALYMKFNNMCDTNLHMITLVKAAANDWKTYTDGVEDETSSTSKATFTANDYAYIGSAWVAGSKFWNMTCWSSDLSATEVANLYALGSLNTYAALNIDPAAVIHHWPMAEGAGSKILDVVGGNHGTSAGSPTWVTKATYPVGPMLIHATAGGAPPSFIPYPHPLLPNYAGGFAQ